MYNDACPTSSDVIRRKETRVSKNVVYSCYCNAKPHNTYTVRFCYFSELLYFSISLQVFSIFHFLSNNQTTSSFCDTEIAALILKIHYTKNHTSPIIKGLRLTTFCLQIISSSHLQLYVRSWLDGEGNEERGKWRCKNKTIPHTGGFP